jgi:hypothetical protein
MNVESISVEELKNSFFYPASNGDVFPLVKFEFDTFIYVDFMYDISILLGEMNSYLLTDQPDPYRISGEVRNYLFKDIFDTAYIENASRSLQEMYSEEDLEYLYMFCDVPMENCKVQLVDLVKRSGRKSKMIFINYEALTAYLTLFCCGGTAPYALCTTITGHHFAMEEIFPVLFHKMSVKPRVWMSFRTRSEHYKYHLGKMDWESTCEMIPVDVYSISEEVDDHFVNIFDNKQ